MPELPEVETVCRTLRRHVVGHTLEALEVVEPRLRWPIAEAALRAHAIGRRVVAIRRRAKYILIDLEASEGAGTTVMAVHLGMSGILRVVRPEVVRRKHDHVILSLSHGLQVRFNDPRRFGSLVSFEAADELEHPRFAGLGAEPLAPAFDADFLFKASRRSTRSLKVFIMDARVVVGVGNIYASEALWRSRLAPGMAAGRLSRAQAGRLRDAIVETLQDAIEQGGTTLRDFSDADAHAGQFGQRLCVYGREHAPCPVCRTPIKKRIQGQRSTYYCPRCQSHASYC